MICTIEPKQAEFYPTQSNPLWTAGDGKTYHTIDKALEIF